MAFRPDAQASFRAESKLEPLPSSPLPSSPLPSSPLPSSPAWFAPRSAVARLVSLITSFKDASGKGQLKGPLGLFARGGPDRS